MPLFLELRKNAHSAHSAEKDTPTPPTRHDRLDCSPGCAVEAVLQFIDGKWKGVILWHLMVGTLRFNQIRRLLPSVMQRMLTNQLRELEVDGFVERRVYAPGHQEIGATLLKVRLTVPSPEML